MTLHTTPSIAPHITTLLRGKKLQDISFVEHPPAKWSWHLALAMAKAIMDPATKQYWDSHKDKGLQELCTYLGQTWSRHSKTNLKDFPDIFPHAAALFETLMLRSQPALIRLYGPDGDKVTSYVSQGLMTEGIEQYPHWLQSYYGMRQSIETDDTLQNHLNTYVARYPSGWTHAKEARYQHAAETSWYLLPVHPPMESIMDWFHPATMAVVPIRTVVSSHTSSVDSADDIAGVPYEALTLSKQGAIQITGLLGQSHEVSYIFNLSFSPAPIAGSRPLHAQVIIERSTELTDEPSLQQMHAMTLAHAVTKSLGLWLNHPSIKEQTKRIKFEPSVSVECELRDPEANLVWLDTVQDHLLQFMQEAFNLPTTESTIRRTL